MKHTRTELRDICVIGFALFSMFFGAGNLIFPVHMGQMAGKNVWLAIIGLCVTGVGLPLLGVAALGCMACEGAIYDWSGLYLRDVVGVPASRQSFGYFGYLCTMVTGRFVADRLIDRFGVGRILCGSGLCISGGLALAVAFGGGALALWGTVLGFALVGCGTSAVVPICLGVAGKSRDLAPSIAIAEVSTIGFFGFLAAPPLIGYVAHATSLRVSFAMMSAIGLLVLLATWALRRHLSPLAPGNE